ncbi:MAG: hypothetical protein Ta2A_12980 [Treponemataceae bacterium]|nr:MAG: hypothetical protein Ta2A_12980 [Treponemataceae bacterium]
MKKIVSVLLATSLVVGAAFAQDADVADKGTFTVGGNARIGGEFDLKNKEVRAVRDNDANPGFGGEVTGTYKNGDAQLLIGFSTYDGAFLRGRYGSLGADDTTDWGGAFQSWTGFKGWDPTGRGAASADNLFSYDRFKAYLFVQLFERKLLIDAKAGRGWLSDDSSEYVDYNTPSYGTDWDLMSGGLWAAPTDIITDTFSGTRGFGVQIKPVDGFNFGFSLAPLKVNAEDMGEYFAKTTVGVKYDNGFVAALGFTPVDTKFHASKAYVGIKIPLLSDALGIYANAAAYNFGEFGDNGRIDVAARAEFKNDIIRSVGANVRLRGLVHNNVDSFFDNPGDGVATKDATTLNINPWVKYDFVKDVFMGKLEENLNIGILKNSEKSSTSKTSVSIWYVLKGDMQDNLGDMNTGLGLQYDLEVGALNNPQANKVLSQKVTLGAKVSF